MPTFSQRTRGYEWMDDLGVAGEPLTESLDQLRWVNRFLGGYSASLSVLAPWLQRQSGRTVRLLDVGTGIADFPEEIARWAARHAPALDLDIVAVDGNPATIDYARRTLDRRLPPSL